MSNWSRMVRQPSGYNSAPTWPVWVRISDEVWCEHTGCPVRECVQCKLDKVDNIKEEASITQATAKERGIA